MGELRSANIFANAKEDYEQEDQGIDDRSVFKEIIGVYRVRLCTGVIWLAIGTSGTSVKVVMNLCVP
jgi:hypothetical protein